MPKPIVALYKTYRGGEWFRASLESVREQCVGIVAVTSDQPWPEQGEWAPPAPPGAFPPENCKAPLTEFEDRHPEIPVVRVDLHGRNGSNTQYTTGLKAIKRRFGGRVGVLIVDTDEVWEPHDLLALRTAMTEHPEASIFRSAIWTYLRSPLYRVAPQERARVVVGLRDVTVPPTTSRWSRLPRTGIYDVLDCVVHHHGYVRFDPEEITAKLDNCTTQDTVPVLHGWKQKVWDRLPHGVNLHPQRGFEACWRGIRELRLDDCPQAVLDSDAFWGGLAYHAPDRLYDLLTKNDFAWRRRVGNFDPERSPVTTVSEACVMPLWWFLCAVSGRALEGRALMTLMPRLRMSLRETMQLAALVAQVPPGGRALEVGSGLGGSIAVMMLSSPQTAKLIAVDPFLPYDEQNVNLVLGVREGSLDKFQDTVSEMVEAGCCQDVLLHHTSSREAADRVERGSLDLLLIDGNHSYVNCQEDLALWWPKLRVGGTLLVHDFATRFPGVIQAVREFEAEHDIKFDLPALSTLAWLRKP